VKLLLDENLSRRIIPFIVPSFPGSSQISLLNMESFTDIAVWNYAKKNDFVIVTKDADFYDMSVVFGTPPQIIWLRNGNVKKNEITQTLIENKSYIEKALNDEMIACLEIFKSDK